MYRPSYSSTQSSISLYGSESDLSQRSFERTQALFTESQEREEDRLREARQDECIRRQAIEEEERRKQEQNLREATERSRRHREEYEALRATHREEEERRRKQEADDDVLMCL